MNQIVRQEAERGLRSHASGERVNLQELIRLVASGADHEVLLKTLKENPFYRRDVEASGNSVGRDLVLYERRRLATREYKGVGTHVQRLESVVVALYVLDGSLVVSTVEDPSFAVTDGKVRTRQAGFTSQLLGIGECFIVTEGIEFVLSSKGEKPALVLELELFAKHHGQEIEPATAGALVAQIDSLADYYYGYEKRYTKIYEKGAQLWETAEANEVLRYVLSRYPSVGRNVIDLGCGEGRDSIYLASLGYYVVGVDVSRSAFDRARARSASCGVVPRFLERDVIALRNIPDCSFHLAINMGCLHMLIDPAHRAGHLASVFRVLLPGGTFVITHCEKNWGKGFFSIPHYDQLGPLVPGTVIDRRIRVDAEYKFVPLEVLPYKESSAVELASEVTAAGFDIVELLHEDTDAFGGSVVLIARKPIQLVPGR